MPRNGRNAPRRPRIEMRQSAATPEEAAAIAAAIEQFLRDTAPAPAHASRPGAWARTAILAGAGARAADPSPWGDAQPWGRTS
jgi:hypothetical protein